MDDATTYPTYVTETQWAESPLGAAPVDDEALRAVAVEYLQVLYEALGDWQDRAGSAAWPEKFKTLDDRLAWFSQKVGLALESADGPRDLTSAVLGEFQCVPSPSAHHALSASHVAVTGTGTIEVFGMVRRELPMLAADVGAAIRARAEERKAGREAGPPSGSAGGDVAAVSSGEVVA